jgi:dipeptidyl aminopeptidase/acylaminoacyl peptidase
MRSTSPRPLVLLLALACFLPAAPAALAQASDPVAGNGYLMPPKALLDIVESAPTPAVEVAPDRRSILHFEWRALTPIADLAAPELRLAGQRFRPTTSGPSRAVPYVSVSIQSLDDGTVRRVEGLPASPRLTNLRWSPDGKRCSFTHLADDGNELWVVELASAKATRLTAPVVSLTLRVAPVWLGNDALLALLVPADRGLPPDAAAQAYGPVVQENLGKTSPSRTYQDLLRNGGDESLFDYYMTSQLARVDLAGKITPLGARALYSRVAPSPDARFLLVEILHRPYSYLVQSANFPTRIEVWDIQGQPVHQVVDRPLQESIPIANGSVPTGPREVVWRADVGATLLWAEAQDGGDSGKEAELRDRLFLLEAPFRGEVKPLLSLKLRFGNIQWSSGELAMVDEFHWKTRQVRTWRIRPDQPQAAPVLFSERSFEDRYADPGAPALVRNEYGREVIATTADRTAIFLLGKGASPEGNRPFVDRYTLADGKKERLFHSQPPYYEEPLALLDEGARYVLARREAPAEQPNFFVRDLQGDRLRQITEFPHPAPSLLGMQKELVQYKRKDGVALSGTLYLPAGWDQSKGPLPTLMWAYPQEFKSADNAGQLTDSPYRFKPVHWSAPFLWVTQGYAVFDDPKMPIIGEKDVEPNDTFVDQLKASAEAAVDELVRRGVAERGRIAVGGHSYGAFMTANLLAHTDLFAAGIARSGAYNRTLTPFGFQSEERSFWQAPEVYGTMSPFNYADRIKEPILLIHGEMDNNSGTFPMQSERFYNALKGHGATTRYVTLPYESHGYQGRESILHTLAETSRWLETYVRLPPVPKIEVAPATPGH